MSKSDKELFVECAAQVAAALTPIIAKRDKSAGAAEYVANFASVVACEIVEKAHTLNYETTYTATEATALAIAAERHAETVHVLRARIKELESLFDKVANERNELRDAMERTQCTYRCPRCDGTFNEFFQTGGGIACLKCNHPCDNPVEWRIKKGET